jgi:hypothetical protein
LYVAQIQSPTYDIHNNSRHAGNDLISFMQLHVHNVEQSSFLLPICSNEHDGPIYPMEHTGCHIWDLSIPIKDGDRIGLFGEDMLVLVI